jgi:hypothetical protein
MPSSQRKLVCYFLLNSLPLSPRDRGPERLGFWFYLLRRKAISGSGPSSVYLPHPRMAHRQPAREWRGAAHPRWDLCSRGVKTFPCGKALNPLPNLGPAPMLRLPKVLAGGARPGFSALRAMTTITRPSLSDAKRIGIISGSLSHPKTPPLRSSRPRHAPPTQLSRSQY